MTDSLFPVLADMQTICEWFGTFVFYGVGLSMVFWTIGYVVWFIVQVLK